MTDELSTYYWQGAARGILVVQRCERCGQLRHYPRILCDRCHSFEASPLEVEPVGEIFSWTVAHHAFDQAFAADLPYTLATVTMSCGVRVLGRLRDTVEPHLGLPVHLNFEPGPDGAPAPVFRPIQST